MANRNRQCSVEDWGFTKDWNRAIIIPIYKNVAEGYVGTGSLLSVLGKAFGRILNERMGGKTEGMIMEETRWKLCRNMFVLQQLVEKMLERGKKVYTAFLDLVKAYDRVWRPGLQKA